MKQVLVHSAHKQNLRQTEHGLKQTFFMFALVACTHLKSVHEVFEIGKIIQARRMTHPVLVQQLVHDKVHKSDLLEEWGKKKLKTHQ